jgi:GTP cyclohydrolase I
MASVVTDSQGRVVDQIALENAVRLLLASVDDPDREGLLNTPGRVVRALYEMTRGQEESPKHILSTTFNEPCDEMVVLSGIGFTSLCEHHLLPFTGTVDVGYIPGKVVGLSKLARLVDCFARRLQIQERLTAQVADSLETHLDAQGVAVIVRGQHACMACRGVRKAGATMVTSAMRGVLKDNPTTRAEFLELIK